MQSILVFFPYPTNTGYAIDSYEATRPGWLG